LPARYSYGMSGIAIEKEALKLSAEEKAHMIDVLWRSLDPVEQEMIDRAWVAESRDRLDAFKAGKLKALDGEEALKSIEAELKK
jgi:putative addiction module component (TIGR02574 family)